MKEGRRGLAAAPNLCDAPEEEGTRPSYTGQDGYGRCSIVRLIRIERL